LSKITAQQEEANRLKEKAKAEGKIKPKHQQAAREPDLDFGSGFQKFATGV
jgi:hypothetical protein